MVPRRTVLDRAVTTRNGRFANGRFAAELRTWNSEPRTRNPELRTPNPEPRTRTNPEPGTRNPEPGSRDGVDAREPGGSASGSDVAAVPRRLRDDVESRSETVHGAFPGAVRRARPDVQGVQRPDVHEPVADASRRHAHRGAGGRPAAIAGTSRADHAGGRNSYARPAARASALPPGLHPRRQPRC